MKFSLDFMFNIFQIELLFEFTLELILRYNAAIALLHFYMPLAPLNHNCVVKVKCSVVNLIGVLLDTDYAEELFHAP